MDKQTQLLIATGIGLIVSDIVPTPADALYFRLEEQWKNELEDGKITPKQYWSKTAIAYYGLNPLWWTLVLASSLTLGQTFNQKVGIFAVMISGGAIFGVLKKNIQTDLDRQSSQIQ